MGSRVQPKESSFMARQSPYSGAASKWLFSLSASLVSTGCGASVEAIYESDVRFEHCMALDARVDVKPAMRRACWAEWAAFYTYGQTRDRLEHAQERIEALGDPSGFVVAGEQPTSAYDQDDDGRRVLCAGTCEAVRVDCADACDGGACQRTCAMGFQRCMLTCG